MAWLRGRHLVASLVAGAALSLVHAACVCDCAWPTCDTRNLALELPPGAVLTLHVTACVEDFDPDEEFPSVQFDLWFDGEDHGRLTLEIDREGYLSDLSYFESYTQALCDEGATATLTNTGPDHVAGTLRLEVSAEDEDRRCALAMELP